MKCIAFATAALITLTAPVYAADCAKDYKDFWDSLSNNGAAKGLTGEQHAMVSRQALRAFDACSAGDAASSKSIFDTIREAAPAKGDDFWKKLSESAPAKKQ